MKVSIISTVYNKELFLENHIESLISQTYDDIEFIFVNDGSTDCSLEILKKYQKKDKRIILINQKNQGPSIARKNGFKHSEGDLIYFVDSDDRLYNKLVIEKIVNIFSINKNIDFIVGQIKNSYDASDELDKIIYTDNIKEGIYDISYLYNKSFRLSLCYKVVKKEYLKEEDFIDSRVYEDGIVTYSIYNRTKKFYYYNKPIYVVNRKNINQDRITNTLNINKIKEKYKNIKIFEKFDNFDVSIKRLKLQSYLDDLNYSLKLKLKDKIELITLAKSYLDKSFYKKEYLILNKHYKTLYKNSYLYSNPIFNLMISKYKFILKIIKNIIKTALKLPFKIINAIFNILARFNKKAIITYYKLKYGKRLLIGKNISFRKSFIINISKEGHLKIGDNCFFNNYCTINCQNSINIGNDNIFGENVKFYDHDHIFNDLKKDMKNNFNFGEIELGNGNWIGTNVVLLRNTFLENNNVVGAGIVLKGKYQSNKLIKGDRKFVVEDINYK